MIRALIFLLIFSLPLYSQNNKPRLVVGIVVDQMRFDYIYKYWDNFGEYGFKKLVNQGYQCKNLQYNYIPTYTAPGHASIYTGTTPARHGIIGNDWYERSIYSSVYCTADSTVESVGGPEDPIGRMSPRRMLGTTVGDELRVHTKLRSKVIGIALKDRSSILPAGHIANAAYWFDYKSGNWITSTFYMDKLPDWVESFNRKQLGAKYLEQVWEPVLPVERYTSSLPDRNPYETPFKGTQQVTFPYDLKKLMAENGGQKLIRYTPFGNSFTVDMALAALEGEDLGSDNITDLLCISFSSTDFVGHAFGTEAMELEDVYIRLDRELERLLNALEKRVGRENLLVFLTADHGGATVPAYLMDLKVPGGYFNGPALRDSVKSWLGSWNKPESWLLRWTNQQIYLDEEAIIAAGENPADIEERLASKLLGFPGVMSVYTADQLRSREFTRGNPALAQRGYNHKRSGHIMIQFEPNWLIHSKTGTTHGSSYSYDTRVPMLWYGWKIAKGETAHPYYIEDIAPTVSWLLNIPFPNATSGNPIPLPLKK